MSYTVAALATMNGNDYADNSNPHIVNPIKFHYDYATENAIVEIEVEWDGKTNNPTDLGASIEFTISIEGIKSEDGVDNAIIAYLDAFYGGPVASVTPED